MVKWAKYDTALIAIRAHRNQRKMLTIVMIVVDINDLYTHVNGKMLIY